MEGKGWVTSSWDMDAGQGPPRRAYKLSLNGDEELRKYIKDLEQAHSTITDLITVYYRHIEGGEGDYH